jgi:hypothetical protein
MESAARIKFSGHRMTHKADSNRALGLSAKTGDILRKLIWSIDGWHSSYKLFARNHTGDRIRQMKMICRAQKEYTS